MNLQELRSKYGKGTAATIPTLGTAEERGKAMYHQLFGNAAQKTKEVTKSTVSAVGGVMPATNRRVDDIAAKFNTRMNNVEMNQRVADVKISMLAQLVGAEMPTDEEIIEALVQQDKEELEAKKAEESAVNVEEAVAKAMTPIFEKMAEVFGSLMGKGVQAEEYIDIPLKKKEEEELFYEPKKEKKTQAKKEETSEPVNKDNKSKSKSTPKKEEKKEEPKKEETSEAPKGKGRRRVKRGASLVSSDNE